MEGTLDHYLYTGHYLTLGAGIGVDISRLRLDVGYEWGVSDLFEFENVRSRVNNLSFTAGLRC